MAKATVQAIRRAAGNRLYRSSILILLTQGFTSAFGYVFWAVAAHRTGPATVGITGSLVSAIAATNLLTITGLTVGIIPIVAVTRDARALKEEIGAAAAATIVLSLFGGVVLTVVIPALVGSLAPAGSPSVAPALILLTVTTGLGLLVDAIALARSRTWIMLSRGMVASVARLSVFALVHRASLPDLVWAFALSLTLADVLAIGLLMPRDALRAPHLAVPKMPRRRSYYFGHHLTSVGGAAAVYLLPVIVLWQQGPTQAGYFYPTWLLAGMFFTISPAVSSAYLASGSITEDSARGRLREATLLILALLAVPMLVAIVDPALVLRLLGPGYAEHGSVLLAVLAVSAIPDAVTNVAVATLRLLERLKAAASLNGSMSVLVLATAVPLLAAHGITGAGESWLLAQTAGACSVPVLIGWRPWRRRPLSGRHSPPHRDPGWPGTGHQSSSISSESGPAGGT